MYSCHPTVSASSEGLSQNLLPFDVALQQVELETLTLLSGEHHELEYRSIGLKRRRDQMKTNALKAMEARTESVNELLAHEIQLIDEDYQSSIDRTKDKMNVELSERIRVIELCRDGGRDTQTTTRSLRSKVKKGEDKDQENEQGDTDFSTNNSLLNNVPASVVVSTNAAVPAGPQGNTRQRASRRALSPSSILLDKQLENEEVAEDIYEINRDEQIFSSKLGLNSNSSDRESPGMHRSKRSTLESRRHGDTVDHISVDLKIGEVSIGGECYYKGEAAVVTSSDTKNIEVVGVITSINNSEIHLKLADNSKFRIYLSHLRNGRATLRHQK